MKQVNKSLVSICLSVFMIGCNNAPRTAKDLIGYVEDDKHGFRNEITINGWVYNIKYKPHAYILYMERNAPALNNANRENQLNGTVWFNIDISRKDKSVTPLRYNVTSVEEYNNRYQYMLSPAQNDIKLVMGSDTLYPMSYAFETTYNLTPVETIVVGYDLPGEMQYPESDFQLIYRDRVFNNGIVKTIFKQSDLKSIDKLKYN